MLPNVTPLQSRFCPLLLSLCQRIAGSVHGCVAGPVLGTAGAALTTRAPAQEMETFLHVLQEKL